MTGTTSDSGTIWSTIVSPGEDKEFTGTITKTGSNSSSSDTTPATQVRAVFVGSYKETHGEEAVLITDTITFEAD